MAYDARLKICPWQGPSFFKFFSLHFPLHKQKRQTEIGFLFCSVSFLHNAISLWTPDTKTDQHEM